MFDFVRISCCVPKVSVANTTANVQDILKKIEQAETEKSNFAVFPELCVTGYSCADLFFQETLLNSSTEMILTIASATKHKNVIVIVGAPFRISGDLYNCAFVMAKGKICGIVPKTFLANHNEFSEKRWFSSAVDLAESSVSIRYADTRENEPIPVGNDLVFQTENGTKFGVEVCEDLWMPTSPSTTLALASAELIFNISASNETVGKRQYCQDMVKLQSSKCRCVYAFVSCGTDESTSDVIFSGHSVIAENGTVVGENEAFLDTDYILNTDVDLGKVKADRLRHKSFKDAAAFIEGYKTRLVPVSADAQSDGELYTVRRHPFIPSDKNERIKRCINIFDMQAKALEKRLKITGGKAVIGVSGGLDSTLALLVTCAAMNSLGNSLENVCAVTMPCFGTTDRTYNNAIALMKALGVTIKNISIKEACIGHFKDIGHDINVHDVTYENVQARERTQVLMDLSNSFGGIVIGTGDLSELALGWCTYCGDQMSMYGVNCGIPKTLIRWMIESIVDADVFPAASETLRDVLETPISPELLPPDESGKIAQKTEDVVGPYELHDFFLYYVLRYGYSPSKVYYLAKRAFAGEYENSVILKWLRQFYRRFFTQQFKRSPMPDGIKIGNVSLSPKADLKMPSDAECTIWLNETDALDGE